MASIKDILTFINRVLHLISTMFVAGMCTISYLADNNLYANPTLSDWNQIFGIIVLVTGLYGLYRIHKWFKYWLSDRYIRTFVILLFLKMFLAFAITPFFEKLLEFMSISYTSSQLNTFRFYSIVTIFFLASFLKYYKEKYVIKSGSELDKLVY